MSIVIRKNQRPSFLRHVVRRLSGCHLPDAPLPGLLPSHHILCAGTYSPVFARLAAECALASCPSEQRQDFRLYIHVDGLARKARQDLLAWLGEIPGVTLSYGMFGILPQDRIPGKWHQTMINDVVKHFRTESHLAFIDADLFLADDSWWVTGLSQLAADVYAVTVGLRRWATMTHDGRDFHAQTTNLFTLNTAAHLALNHQQCNKDRRAMRRLQQDYSQANFAVERVDTLIVASLRAQAEGMRVIDVEDRITHCHVGGFSHLGLHKFHNYEAPERRPMIDSLLGRFRLLSAVLDYFDSRGWGRFVESGYRHNVVRTWAFLRERPLLMQWLQAIPPTPHEQVFDRVVQAHY